MIERITNLEQMPQALNYLIYKVEEMEELVNKLSAREAAPEPKEWMDINELCEYLPTHPAKPTVYGWVNDKSIPYYKNSKKLTFRKSEVDDWLHQRRSKSTDFLMKEAEEFMAKKKKKLV